MTRAKKKPFTTPGTPEDQLRVAEAWRAVLGLPKDFPIGPMQITVCMAAAQLLLCEPEERKEGAT